MKTVTIRCTIQWLLVNPELYNCHHYLLEHFHWPKKKPSACKTDFKTKITEVEVKGWAPNYSVI